MKNIAYYIFTTLFLIPFNGCVTINGPTQKIDPGTFWSFSPVFEASRIRKIAVVVEKSEPKKVFATRYQSNGGYSNAVDSEFTGALLKKGYRITNRSDIDKILQEIKFQKSGLTNSQNTAKLGRMLNVNAILVVTISNTGVEAKRLPYSINYQQAYRYVSWCEMSAKLYSVEQAEVLGSAFYTGSYVTDSRDNTSPAIRWTARVIASGFPSIN